MIAVALLKIIGGVRVCAGIDDATRDARRVLEVCRTFKNLRLELCLDEMEFVVGDLGEGLNKKKKGRNTHLFSSRRLKEH